jgi:hypothetical protein
MSLLGPISLLLNLDGLELFSLLCSALLVRFHHSIMFSDMDLK